ncbi:hypothetical protein HPB49_009703 [Dermacentor silvarum]|uniref:Uncharacterized protein n=1 Tax=Dermacentor silvarum TaxID=543639 RepID=A0ACB8CEE7_DERSI|nr:hypothetical protein HPB49_009703 [Dermacentor silvarum]
MVQPPHTPPYPAPISDHNHPTRVGTSVSIDTTLDLTFTRNVPQAQWSNLGQNLGSNNFILLSRIKAGPAKRIGIKTSLTNWDKRHELRNEHAPTHISSLKEWATTLLEDVAAVTEEVPETAGLEEVDTHLLHLWQARMSIQNRWHKRLNRKLRLKFKEESDLRRKTETTGGAPCVDELYVSAIAAQVAKHVCQSSADLRMALVRCWGAAALEAAIHWLPNGISFHVLWDCTTMTMTPECTVKLLVQTWWRTDVRRAAMRRTRGPIINVHQ